MSYHIVRPADHDGWLAERKKGLGSSDAGTLMGVSPFSTPLRLWRQRMGIDPPVKETDAMRDGHFYELAVTEYFAAVTKSVIDYTSVGDWLAVDDQREYLRVSPDRLFWPEGAPRTPENRLILEIKSTSKFVDPDNLPYYWLCQVQYQMGIMGIHMAAIAWLTSMPRLQMGHTWIKFNPAFFKTITDTLDHFWNHNILKGIEPEPMDPEDCKLLWPVSSVKDVPATDSDLEDCRHWRELSDEIEKLENEKTEVETRIKTSLTDGESLVFTDPETGKTTQIARYKSVNETVFDEETFQKENPDKYADYCLKTFDKAMFKEENKVLFNKYASTRKGARRFSVLLK